MQMRDSIAATLAVVVLAAPVFGADKAQEGKKLTVQGTLVDTKCYGMMNSNIANDHQTPKGLMPACGTACAATGIPVGVLEGGKAGGNVVVLVTPAPALASHVAKEARVSGTAVFGGSLIPDKIEVREKGGKWEEVNIATMM